MSILRVEDRRSNARELETTLDPEWVRSWITRETRSWGFWLLLSGFVQLVASNLLDPVWGVILILLAAASFYFRSAAMLPVCGAALAWAMVGNLLSGESRWFVLGLVQAYGSFTTFRQFLIIRRATARLGIGLGADTSMRADLPGGIFPWAGCAMSAAAPLTLFVVIAGAVAWYLTTGQELSDQVIEIASGGVLGLAFLGLAFGLAGLLAQFRWRAVSILAVIGGALMLGLATALAILLG